MPSTIIDIPYTLSEFKTLLISLLHCEQDELCSQIAGDSINRLSNKEDFYPLCDTQLYKLFEQSLSYDYLDRQGPVNEPLDVARRAYVTTIYQASAAYINEVAHIINHEFKPHSP